MCIRDRLYNYAMIKLTLQPVVENCFMYGMEGIDLSLIHILLSRSPPRRQLYKTLPRSWG